ncbi:MAG: hypothetical protein KGL39_52450 [Patescibacteria group bacterium]|nr:hypothetical protein [Patescibacteria group bacterium]
MILLYLLLFYWGFAAAIAVYRQWLAGRLNWWNKVLFAPLLAGFFLTDVILNWTLLVFVMGAPPMNCATISERFAIYHEGDKGWRGKVAAFVCDELLNTIDPAGAHC